MENRQTRRVPVGVVATVSALLVAVGGGTAWWAVNSEKSDPLTSVNPVNVEPNAPDPSMGGTEEPKPTTPSAVNPSQEQVQIYLIQDTGTQLELAAVPVSVQGAQQPSEALTAAFERLLAEPEEGSAFSEIPQGTKLLSAQVNEKGVYVNLSPEFTTGGGSTSMTARLGQVVYTATSLDPNALVWISVGGEPLEILGGEGLEVPQPITRQIFQTEFPL